MKKVKDIKVCIAEFRALQNENDIEPERKKYIDDAIELLKQLRRKSRPAQPEVARFVRRISEALLKAVKK